MKSILFAAAVLASMSAEAFVAKDRANQSALVPEFTDAANQPAMMIKDPERSSYIERFLKNCLGNPNVGYTAKETTDYCSCVSVTTAGSDNTRMV